MFDYISPLFTKKISVLIYLKIIIPIIGIILFFTVVFLVFRLASPDEPVISGPIIFFGDSITAGNGVEKPFVAIIGEELGVETINAGVAGDTTGYALQRIENDVINKNPAVVVLEFGGNDFLQGVAFDSTAMNFNEIMTRLTTETEAKIIIAAVRVDLLKGNYERLQEEVAKVYDVEFVPNIMKGIFGNPNLMLDGIHPNGEGHKKIAEKLIKEIKPLVHY